MSNQTKNTVPNTEPFDEGTGYSDVVTPGTQRPPRDVRVVNAQREHAGNDSGGEGGTSGNHGGDATENPSSRESRIPEKPRPIP